jgi:hypothetical protein
MSVLVGFVSRPELDMEPKLKYDVMDFMFLLQLLQIPSITFSFFGFTSLANLVLIGKDHGENHVSF